MITAHSEEGETATLQVPREEVPLESQPVASIHDRDPLAENREEAMHEMAALYSALDTLHDPNFVEKHLGPMPFASIP